MLLVLAAFGLAESVVGARSALVPVLGALTFARAAIAVLVAARMLNARAALAATLLLAAFMAIDLAWNNAPHVSTALPPARFEALAPGTGSETVRLLRAELARTPAADRRERVELIGIDYHWPNLGQAQG